MNSIILYSSQTGNTEKLAKHMAKDLKVNCIKLDSNKDYSSLNFDRYDLIFIGSGIYAGKVHKNIISFLNSINLKTSKKFAFFISWFGRGKSAQKAIEQCSKILTSKNQLVDKNYYQCFGQGFKFIRKGHPNVEDLNMSIQWAKEVMHE